MKKKMRATTIRLPSDVMEKLDEIVKEKGYSSRNALMLEIINSALESESQVKKNPSDNEEKWRKREEEVRKKWESATREERIAMMRECGIIADYEASREWEELNQITKDFLIGRKYVASGRRIIPAE